MPEAVNYERHGDVGVISIDDGKANALSPDVFAGVSSSLDHADSDELPVVICGRDGRFSAGFDLKVLTAGGEDMRHLLRTGFETARRCIARPRPVVAACTGHAFAMGLFLLQSADYRIASDGDFKLTANEVAIGMTMPRAAIEICRPRVSRTYFDRVMVQAEVFSPSAAHAAGLVDEVVDPGTVVKAAIEKAQRMNELNTAAFAGTKARVHEAWLAALDRAIQADDSEIAAALGS